MARIDRVWQVNVEAQAGGAANQSQTAPAAAVSNAAANQQIAGGPCDAAVDATASNVTKPGVNDNVIRTAAGLPPLLRPSATAVALSAAAVRAKSPTATPPRTPAAHQMAAALTGSTLAAVDAAVSRLDPSPGAPVPVRTLRIGVLALQGAFAEHAECLQRLAPRLLQEEHIGLEVRLVRTAREMRGEHEPVNEAAGVAAAGGTGSASALHGLVLPGGESTAMRRLLRDDVSSGGGTHGNDLLTELRRWVHSDRPTFGTCAGSILLADRVLQPDEEGDIGTISDDHDRSALAAASPFAVHADPTDIAVHIGGVAMTVARNYYGRQLASFSTSDIQLHDADLIAAGEDGAIRLKSAATGTHAAVNQRDDHEAAMKSESLNPATSATATGPSLPAAASHRGSGVFIRAPAMLALGPRVRVLASLPHAEAHRRGGAHLSVEGGAAFQHDQQLRQAPMAASTGTDTSASPAADDRENGAAVGVRSGNLLATTFHPELPVDADTPVDLRWHRYFVRMAAAVTAMQQ